MHSLTQIGLGAEAWAFVPGVKYGSWWAAMIVVVSGILALIANNKYVCGHHFNIAGQYFTSYMISFLSGSRCSS